MEAYRLSPEFEKLTGGWVMVTIFVIDKGTNVLYNSYGHMSISRD